MMYPSWRIGIISSTKGVRNSFRSVGLVLPKNIPIGNACRLGISCTLHKMGQSWNFELLWIGKPSILMLTLILISSDKLLNHLDKHSVMPWCQYLPPAIGTQRFPVFLECLKGFWDPLAGLHRYIYLWSIVANPLKQCEIYCDQVPKCAMPLPCRFFLQRFRDLCPPHRVLHCLCILRNRLELYYHEYLGYYWHCYHCLEDHKARLFKTKMWHES